MLRGVVRRSMEQVKEDTLHVVVVCNAAFFYTFFSRRDKTRGWEQERSFH